MKNIGLNELRRMFRDFYVEKGHYPAKSFSLVPERDKSLLLINSGMAPLKPYFAGQAEPPSKRMTTCQKCIRTGDLDNVGHTSRHGTFFEMLGSFSFGDYFKRESLKWGWEFLTEVLEMPVGKLWATVYEEDDEAYDIWVNEVGIAADRVVRLGKDDNFWEIGIGPCGPCSEIYFDRGEKFGCGREDCKPGCDCDRYVEFWNHVFTQFNKDEAGNYTPLAHPNIDTGMGLERLACIMQDTDSIFDVDTIRNILLEVCRRADIVYEDGAAETDAAIRIITDHIRSVVFMIGDGIIPSNEGRGYVLRRLLRRAAVNGKKLGIKGLFLHDLADKVIETSGHEYEEIAEKQDYIKKLIRLEEERFAITIDQGLELLDAHIRELKGMEDAILSGDKVFKLYDTFGVNPELTREVLAEHDIAIDEDGFLAELRIQQENSRRGQKATEGEAWKANEEIYKGLPETEFVGYDTLQNNVSVIAIVSGGDLAEEAFEGETVALVFDKTPFYAESGGQATDIGNLSGQGGNVFYAEVTHVAKAQGVFIHTAILKSGSVKAGDTLTASVNAVLRHRTMRNHTATHLLHQALKDVLGSHVRQAGSSVDAESVRFDFTHFEGLDAYKLNEVEVIVNRVIDEFAPVNTTITTLEEARAKGSAALFDEKYGDKVRMVEVGEFSRELCGGTHAANSGEIGGFKIISESSVGSGTRRIEAITGTNLLKPLIRAENVLTELSDLFKAHPDVLMDKISGMLNDMKETKRELELIRKGKASDTASALLVGADEVGGVRLVKHVFDDLDADEMRSLIDEWKTTEKGLAIVLVSKLDGKLTIVCSLTDDLITKGLHAGKMVKELAQAAGGGGGGKADMAQAGAKDVTKAKDVLAAADAYLSSVR
ncbi:alanine--tRNA ligase [Clostridia bacterium]|nr:alanine--tRNA ligase [Clostridia bacterium]